MLRFLATSTEDHLEPALEILLGWANKTDLWKQEI